MSSSCFGGSSSIFPPTQQGRKELGLNFSASGRTANRLEGRQCIDGYVQYVGACVLMGGGEFRHTIAICFALFGGFSGSESSSTTCGSCLVLLE